MRIITLKQNHEFRRLYRKGVSAGSPFLVIYYGKNRVQVGRLGLTVGSKVGKAVTRNRIRRCLKEIYRAHMAHLKPGYDIVVVARPRCAFASYSDMERDFLRLGEKLKLFETEGG